MHASAERTEALKEVGFPEMGPQAKEHEQLPETRREEQRGLRRDRKLCWCFDQTVGAQNCETLLEQPQGTKNFPGKGEGESLPDTSF